MCDSDQHLVYENSKCVCDSSKNYSYSEKYKKCTCNVASMHGCLECEKKDVCSLCDKDADFVMYGNACGCD